MRFWGIILLVMAGVFAFVVGHGSAPTPSAWRSASSSACWPAFPPPLVFAGRRRAEEEEEEMDDGYTGRYGRRGGIPMGHSAPGACHRLCAACAPPRASRQLCSMAASQTAMARRRHCPPRPTHDRRRRAAVVGEQEEWITEW